MFGFDSFIYSESIGTPPKLEPGFYQLSAGISQNWGQIGEYVYSASKSTRTDRLLSQLDWDIQPGYTLDFDIVFRLPKQLFLGAGYSLGIPGYSGTMVNRDWISPNPPISSLNDPTNPTHYSKHDNYLRENATLDILFGHTTYVSGITASIFGGFTMVYFYMEGRNGSAIYPGLEERDFYGTVISYSQLYRIPSLGISLEFELTPRITWEIRGKAGALVQVFAVDNHYLRNLIFYDLPRGGVFLGGGTKMEWELNRISRLWIQLEGFMIPRFRGDGYYLDTSQANINPIGPIRNSVGASLSHMGISIGISLNGNI